MLGKLLKYEFKATGRVFLPLYGAIVALALINKLLFLFLPELPGAPLVQLPKVLTMTLYVLMILAVCFLTLFITVQRFYQNLLRDEGYLSFTLPVPSYQHILAKLIVSLVWMLLSAVVVMASIFFMVMGRDFFAMLGEGFRYLFVQIDANGQFIQPFSILFSFFVLVVCSSAMLIMTFYLALALGQLFNRNKILASFGAYLVINTVLQIVSVVLMVLGIAPHLEALSVSALDLNAYWYSIMYGGAAYSLLFAAGFFFLTDYVLRKHLNLE